MKLLGPQTSSTASAAMKDEEEAPRIIVEESEQSSSGDPTTTNNSDRASVKSDRSFTRQETKQVNRSKMLVYVALALAAAAVGALAYYFTTRGEEEQFQTEVSPSGRPLPQSSSSHWPFTVLGLCG